MSKDHIQVIRAFCLIFPNCPTLLITALLIAFISHFVFKNKYKGKTKKQKQKQPAEVCGFGFFLF